MTPIKGSCHCGNIQFEFIRPGFDPDGDDTLPVRTCTCSFCVKHGGVYTSHPQGKLTARVEDDSLVQRYQFGTGTAHFYICKRCGIFTFVTSEIAGNLYAVVNVNTFDNVPRDGLVPTPMDFEGEQVDKRLDRRTQTWISTVQIEPVQIDPAQKQGMIEEQKSNKDITEFSSNSPRQRPTSQYRTPRSSSSQSRPSPRLLPEESADFAYRHAAFAFELFRTYARLSEDGENLCLSPYSATVALAMAYNGAGGSTKTQMAEMLHVSDLSTHEFNRLVESAESSIAQYGAGAAGEESANSAQDVEYLSANSMWINDNFDVHEAYIAVCQQRFNARIATVPFRDEKTLDLINGWVAHKTHNKILDLLETTDDLDALALINALYFQGLWKHQFQARLTRDRRFTCGDGATKLVPMMGWAKPTSVPCLENELFESVALPYKDAALSLFLLKPVDNQTLETVINGLQAKEWSEWLTQYEFMAAQVSLPRFKVEAEMTMNDTLQKLGMVDAFGPADFSGMSDTPVYISQVKQKTYLKVDEKGSEAAAATVVMMTRSGPPPAEFEFVADRPFLSVLYDHDSGAILLITAVNSPEEQS